MSRDYMCEQKIITKVFQQLLFRKQLLMSSQVNYIAEVLIILFYVVEGDLLFESASNWHLFLIQLKDCDEVPGVPEPGTQAIDCGASVAQPCVSSSL